MPILVFCLILYAHLLYYSQIVVRCHDPKQPEYRFECYDWLKKSSPNGCVRYG